MSTFLVWAGVSCLIVAALASGGRGWVSVLVAIGAELVWTGVVVSFARFNEGAA